jgi:hypothetical protein
MFFEGGAVLSYVRCVSCSRLPQILTYAQSQLIELPVQYAGLSNHVLIDPQSLPILPVVPDTPCRLGFGTHPLVSQLLLVATFVVLT